MGKVKLTEEKEIRMMKMIVRVRGLDVVAKDELVSYSKFRDLWIYGFWILDFGFFDGSESRKKSKNWEQGIKKGGGDLDINQILVIRI